jgi:hypothetical protein
VKMGRRLRGVGEASSLCFFTRGQSEDASTTHCGKLTLNVYTKGERVLRIECGYSLKKFPSIRTGADIN